MKKARFKVVFNRKGKLNKNGKAPVEIQLYQDARRKFLSPGVLISPENWDPISSEVVESDSTHKDFNKDLRRIISRLHDIQTRCFEDNKSFSIHSISINDFYREPITDSFLDFVKAELKNNQILKEKTKTSHTNTMTKLRAFNDDKDVRFSDLTYGFVDYLHGEGLAVNTVHKQHKNLKKFIEVGIKKGLYDLPNPCKDIKVKYEQRLKDVLSIDDIKTIENLDLSNYDDNLKIIRDLFLFAYYAAGRRIGCCVRMKTDSIKKKDEGYYIDYITYKANKQAIVPLYSLFKTSGRLSKPESLVAKYWREDNELLFPLFSEPYINRNLKVIGKEASLSFPLKFKTARDSFGTHMASKIPIPQLMQLMQHSDVQTTMGYVNYNQEMVEEGLLKVDWKD